MKFSTIRRGILSLSALAMAALAPAGLAFAASPSQIIYVSTSGSDTSGQGTASTPYATIQHAVSVAAAGATIEVEPGTYHGMVVITEPLTLTSDGANGGSASNTTIDATGAANGILIKGSAASGTTVQGLTITNAQQAGLLAIGPISNLMIMNNAVVANDQGFIANDTKAPMDGKCSAAPNGDCEALHLMSATDSMIVGNTVANNLDGGIYLTDEFGPNSHNQIERNVVKDNQVDCGITLASHNPKSISNPKAGGVYDNLVYDNTTEGNGAAGILMATPLPGGATYDNVAVDNTVSGNQGGGVVMHTHSPGANVTGNVIVGNTITGNTADHPVTQKSVGISLSGTVSVISATIANNMISNEYYGIWDQNAKVDGINSNQDATSVNDPVYVPAKTAPQPNSNTGSSTSSNPQTLIWQLTHHPIGYFGSKEVALQQAADVIVNTPNLPSLFDLTHHHFGYFGQNLVAAQHAADVLWTGGIHSLSQTGTL